MRKTLSMSSHNASPTRIDTLNLRVEVYRARNQIDKAVELIRQLPIAPT